MASKKDNYIGLQMGLNTDDLKAGITQAKKEISTARKEFNATTAGMDDWTKSVEGLNAKLSQLDKTINAQKRIVASYENEIQKATEAHGENSEQVRRLKDQLLDAQTALGKSEKSHRKYAKVLQEVESDSKETTTATGKLTKAFKDADDASDRLGDGFTVLKGVMAGLITSGINAMVSGLQNVVQESREFRTEMAYLQATADTTGTSFEHVKENVKEVQSILGETDSAVEGMNNLMSAGFDGSALDAITDELVGASIKWHDTLRFEGLADGLQETLATGEAVGPFAELLERAGLDLETFNQGLAGATTQAEKQNYVLETLAGLGLTEVKEAFEETNQSLIDGSKAEWEYSEAMAQVGETAEPVLNAVKMGFADVLKAIFDTSNGFNTADIAGKISEAFSWFIETCVPFIQSALTWIIENFRTVATVVGLVGGAFLAWKTVSILKDTISGIKDMVKWLGSLRNSTILMTIAENARAVATTLATGVTTLATGAVALLNTTLMGFPLTWIIGAIVAVIAIVVLLWKNWDQVTKWLGDAWEWLKEKAMVVWNAIVGVFKGALEVIKKAWSTVTSFFSGIWNGIKKAFSGVISFFSSLFTNAWNAIKNAWSGVTGWFGGIWSGIKNKFSGVVSFFSDLFSRGLQAIKNAFGSVGDFFSGVVSDIVGFFSGLPGKLFSIGQDMMNGLIDGVKSMIDKVKNAVKNAVESAISGVKDFLGIASPSKLMRDEIGKMMGEGVGEGILASTKDVLKDAGRFTDTITSGLSQAVPAINAGLSATADGLGSRASGTVVNNNYSQVINAPKQPSRLELYRQTKNLLSLKGGY